LLFTLCFFSSTFCRRKRLSLFKTITYAKTGSPIQHNSSNLAPDSSGFGAISRAFRVWFELIQAQFKIYPPQAW
jgi:hypothetical protein